MRAGPLLLVAAITFVTDAHLAHGHVAPSVDDNNRYLKVTPMGDRVRFAYTVFFGEVPGAGERRQIDRNRDGTIDNAEAKAFGDKLAAEVLANLDVRIDGAPTKLAWSIVDVGLGSPLVAAGSFSVDMIAYPCLPQAFGKHTFVITDRFRVPHPGETEVKVEDTPGVVIERAHVGAADDATHDYKFVGPGGPLSDDGLEVVFTATDKAPAPSDGACKSERQASGKSRTWIWIVVIAGALVASIGGILLAKRYRR